MTPAKEEVVEVIKTIIDPDLFIDIWTLGLIYGIEFDESDDCLVTMTFTSVACPAGPMLMQEITDKVSAMEGVNNVKIDVTFKPPWEPSEELKAMMGLL